MHSHTAMLSFACQVLVWRAQNITLWILSEFGVSSIDNFCHQFRSDSDQTGISDLVGSQFDIISIYISQLFEECAWASNWQLSVYNSTRALSSHRCYATIAFQLKCSVALSLISAHSKRTMANKSLYDDDFLLSLLYGGAIQRAINCWLF